MEDNKQQVPAEEKPAEEQPKQAEEQPAAEQPQASAEQIKANEMVEENAKLKAFRNETVLKQNGFKPEYNGWIQAIIEKDGKSFDNAEEIAAYLKDKKFDVFRQRTMVDTTNVATEKKEENAQGKKPKTQEEIDTTYIYVPGLDKEKNN